jgi:hypothetical protein
VTGGTKNNPPLATFKREVAEIRRLLPGWLKSLPKLTLIQGGAGEVDDAR